jgi:hypothetical protein
MFISDQSGDEVLEQAMERMFLCMAAIRPPRFHHELAAMLEVIREPDNRISESVGSLWRFHISSMHQIA